MEGGHEAETRTKPKLNMRTKTNNWTEKQNARRYMLHQRLKSEFEYSAKGRVIHVAEGQIEACTGVARNALAELRDVFGYNIQNTIERVGVGHLVRIHAGHEKEKERGMCFSVLSIAGQTAMIQPTSGRWRRERPCKIKHLFSVNQPATKKRGKRPQQLNT